MTELSIDALVAAASTDVAAHLDPERVAHYAAQGPETIEPVVVFRTPDGLLLADGYHRLAAARRRGESTITADVRHGSRHDALQYAATVAATQRGITGEQALAHIMRRSGRSDHDRR
jgi:hypothetical protein